MKKSRYVKSVSGFNYRPCIPLNLEPLRGSAMHHFQRKSARRNTEKHFCGPRGVEPKRFCYTLLIRSYYDMIRFISTGMVRTPRREVVIIVKRTAILLVLGFLSVACWPFSPQGAHKIDVTGLPFKGSPDAPVTVAVFSDYQ